MNGSSWLDHNFDNYQLVEQDASAVVQRGILNFTGAVTVTDNPSNGSTDVAITGASVPTGTGFWHITSGGSDAAAKLVANADVSSSAAIDVSKLAPGSNGQFLTVVGGVVVWDASPPDTGITQLTGDVTAGPGSGSVAATVAKINGIAVSGTPAAGAVLRATSTSAASWGQLDLADTDAVTGVLPAGNQAAQTMGGDVTGTTAASVVEKLTGATGEVKLTDGSHLNLSSSGTHPTTGLLRSKFYGSDTVFWQGLNSVGAEANILRQSANALFFGDKDASNGWSTYLYGYGVVMQSYAGMQVNAQTAAMDMYGHAQASEWRWLEYATSNVVLALDSAVAGGSTALHFGKDIIASFSQDPATTDVATKDLTIQAQAPFASATGENRAPGHLVVNIPPHAIPTTAYCGGFSINYDGARIVAIGEYANGGAAYGSIWFGGAAVAPSNVNYSFLGNGTQSYFNATTEQIFTIGGSSYPMSLNSSRFAIGAGTYTVYQYLFDLSATAILHFGVNATSAKIQYDAKTSDVATTGFTVAGQDAYASATGTNQTGGSLSLLSGANKSGYTTNFPGVQIGQNGDVFAASGKVRVAKDFTMWARNAGNSADLALLTVASDVMSFGGQNGDAGVYVSSAETLMYSLGTTTVASDDAVQIGGNSGIGGIASSGAGSPSPRGWQWQVTSIDVTAGDVTASAAKAACVIITATGTPGGVNTIVLPDIEGSFYIVINAAGSGANVRFAKASGGGVSVAVNKSQIIRHNGSDYVLVTTAA